ncbi:cytochrome C [Neisseria iguanae]|uniref:Cytochrome C n=1 Tax=Neisseria iguanae TaxID=90242 RepID=A0A2P7U1X5_9NEIS|nr:cytochrome C [Neisseria iguanae]PSJ80984.1 cytochrome C [Neisseria iguanae]
MNTKFLLPISVLLMLSACNKISEAPAQTAASTPAASSASAPVEKENTIQELNSKDSKIRIMIQNAQFTDIIEDKNLHPEGISSDELTLLQRDNTSGITLYAANLGKAKTDAKAYFTHLKETLQSAKGMDNMRVGIATDNRMNYRFSQATENGSTLSENCIAIHETNIYTVCASSTTAPTEQLAVVLKDISLIK